MFKVKNHHAKLTRGLCLPKRSPQIPVGDTPCQPRSAAYTKKIICSSCLDRIPETAGPVHMQKCDGLPIPAILQKKPISVLNKLVYRLVQCIQDLQVDSESPDLFYASKLAEDNQPEEINITLKGIHLLEPSLFSKQLAELAQAKLRVVRKPPSKLDKLNKQIQSLRDDSRPSLTPSLAASIAKAYKLLQNTEGSFTEYLLNTSKTEFEEERQLFYVKCVQLKDDGKIPTSGLSLAELYLRAKTLGISTELWESFIIEEFSKEPPRPLRRTSTSNRRVHFIDQL